ncbi:hypothetical protein FFT09_06975 [Saccharomonospora piscinae]|uniref:hypothetical protein n=1 Tax=Saccharomonospora piscinae TaxID=687388 RepID=UPI00110589CA|nr:hypothetical protein [Saccharomonospora piscinae]TLW93160.1 hypothetical protein FFT09_06975 [Saccharomonospora piscinae]
MTDTSSPLRPTHEGLPVYQSGAAPRYMRTSRQHRDDFDLLPGAPARAFVRSSDHGLIPLYQINEAEIIQRRS